MDTLVSLAAFSFIAVASRQIGLFLTRFRLPLISGYLIAGIIAGPFILDFIHVDTIQNIRFIDELSLAFIAFAAGSEMYLEELKSRYRSIAWHTIAQLVTVFILGSAVIVLLADMIPLTADRAPLDRIAVAVLVGAILLARSPSSAIAIVNELRAKGPFTKTLLGVTVVADVVVVIVFAISTSIADVFLTAEALNIGFALLLIVELSLSFLFGFLIGQVLTFILATRLNQYTKITLILLVGYGVFLGLGNFRDFTHANLPFELLFEPLLVCMLASFWVTNRTPYRDEFLRLIELSGPLVYVMFFTLVGDALELDILADIWQVALVLFLLRLAMIFLGSFIGGTIAGDPLLYNRAAWMGYVTQAGVGLGLARQVADEFPTLGDEFATMMISVIVISQLTGPPLFKIAIKMVGESHLPAQPERDVIRDVLILGGGGQSQALARDLVADHWQVVIADTDSTQIQRFDTNDGIQVCLLPDISLESLSQVTSRSTDAVVGMLLDDGETYRACTLLTEHFGIPRIVVRLNDYAWADRFRSLGAEVIYPASAVVSLLREFVRTPQTTSMLLDSGTANKIVQITVTEPDIDGLRLRDLRLPGDVLVLGISREGYNIVPHGHTVIKLGDDLTLVGGQISLNEVTFRLGY